MTKKLSDYASYELGNIESVPPHVEARIVSGLQALEQRVELIERAEPQMIGEDAQPHIEWLWYFDALASQEDS